MNFDDKYMDSWVVMQKNDELSAHSSDDNLYLDTVCFHNTTEGSGIEKIF